MKKSTIIAMAALAASMTVGTKAQTFMPEATLDYPSGLYASFPPGSVDITWDNRPLELVDPSVNDWGEEYVTVFARLGEGEAQPVGAGIMNSFGDPENPDDPDLWYLDIALYELDDLYSFEGNTLTVIIPENVVKDMDGAINPAQEFVFEIMPTFTEYTIDPESGSTLADDDLKVTVDFGGNSIEYLQSEVRAMTYEPVYTDIRLNLGKEVEITEDNKIVVDFSTLAAGEYELVIPEGFVMVTVDGEKCLSPDIWLEYTLEPADSGVEVIENTRQQGVYSINGYKVCDSENASQKNLEKGIYVIDGKRVIISR